MTTYTRPAIGLLYLHADALAADEPTHLGILGALGHNQEWISDKFFPRQLCNTVTGRLPDSTGSVAVDEYGRMFWALPQISYRPGLEVVGRIYTRVGASNDPVTVHLFSTPNLLCGTEDLGHLVDSMGSGPYYDSVEISSSTSAWYPSTSTYLTVRPNLSRDRRHYYISLWASCDTGESGTLQPFGYSFRERRLSAV
jgi:hypothetical protein